MRKTNILITGATGFIGSHLTRSLVADGHFVKIFCRPDSNLGALSDLKIEVAKGDIRDAESVDQAVQGMDIVIHLVSNFRHPEMTDDVCRETNVGGTENILKSALHHKVHQVIHCSTIGVHGHIEKPPANEDSPFNPGDIYQTTKLEAEKLAWRFHREEGLPLTVIRPTSVYGPGDLRMLKMFRMIQKRRFFILGSGEGLFHPIYISDLVNAFRICLDNMDTIGKKFIIGGNEIITLNELSSTIADQLGVKLRNLHLPIFPFYVLGYLCELICIPLGIRPPIFRRRVKFFVNHRAFDIARARKTLGFNAMVDLKTGIIRTIEWYRQGGYLA